MGLRAINRSPRTSRPASEHRVYPYLLAKVRVTRPSPDVARRHHLPAHGPGFLYLVAIMDWHSRYVVAWRLSNTLERWAPGAWSSPGDSRKSGWCRSISSSCPGPTGLVRRRSPESGISRLSSRPKCCKIFQRRVDRAISSRVRFQYTENLLCVFPWLGLCQEKPSC